MAAGSERLLRQTDGNQDGVVNPGEFVAACSSQQSSVSMDGADLCALCSSQFDDSIRLAFNHESATASFALLCSSLDIDRCRSHSQCQRRCILCCALNAQP